MRLKITMNPTDQVEATQKLPCGDQESDYEDDDRRELISHYANDKYLSKWELADEDEVQHDKSDISLHVHIPSNSTHDSQEKESGKSKTESDQLVAIFDHDDVSLMSYNSIRDCTPSATPKTVPTTEQYQTAGQLPQSAGEDLKLWQGYGGNIYFDAVRCQSMRINSAKSGNSRKEDIAKRWKSKSCIPLKKRDEQQAHTTCITSTPKDVPPTSIHSLGSLRMRSCKERRCKVANCRHKETNRPQRGKICKGFSDKLVTETFQKIQENRGYCSAKEPLAVSGGQVKDSLSDPIDKVQQFNTQHGFPALLTDSSFFSHQGTKKSSSVVDSGDSDPFIKLPLLGKHEGKPRISKAEAGSAVEGSKPVNEPRPVFIIPFGAFDDPVDSDSDVKRKMDKKEKEAAGNSEDGGDALLGSKKETNDQTDGLESNSANLSDHDNNTFNIYLDNTTHKNEYHDGVAKRQVIISGSIGHGRSLRQGVPDFHLKREISNLSLSNYLKAVPTRGSKEQKRLTPSQSALMPKMSYTKRSRALPTFYMMNNSLHRVHYPGFNERMHGAQVYGGYLPTNDRKESKLFYAEISTRAEQNSANDNSCAQDSSRRAKSSGSNRPNSNSPRMPKHAFLRASYVSRNSFTRQNVKRSPGVNEALGESCNKLLPVTGQQISRFSDVHDR